MGCPRPGRLRGSNGAPNFGSGCRAGRCWAAGPAGPAHPTPPGSRCHSHAGATARQAGSGTTLTRRKRRARERPVVRSQAGPQRSCTTARRPPAGARRRAGVRTAARAQRGQLLGGARFPLARLSAPRPRSRLREPRALGAAAPVAPPCGAGSSLRASRWVIAKIQPAAPASVARRNRRR